MGREVTAFLTQLKSIVFAATRESGGLLVSGDKTEEAATA